MALDKLVDVIVQSIQNVSNETHAGFVRAEQKADKHQSTWWSEHGSLKAMVSSVVSMIREIRPATCEGLPKGIAEVLHETNGVRGRIDDLPVDRAMKGLSDIIHIVQESKESLDQIWLWMSDLSREILEVSSLVQETESKVLDRLPKFRRGSPRTSLGRQRRRRRWTTPFRWIRHHPPTGDDPCQLKSADFCGSAEPYAHMGPNPPLC